MTRETEIMRLADEIRRNSAAIEALETECEDTVEVIAKLRDVQLKLRSQGSRLEADLRQAVAASDDWEPNR